MRDHAAIEEKATIALERPVYAYKTCVEFDGRACGDHAQWSRFDRDKSA